MSKILKKYQAMPIQVRASFWFLVCTVLQRSISIITTPVFTRLLTTAEYGKYSVFLSWMGILTCFVTMYLYSGIYPQAIVKYSEDRDRFSSSMQGLTGFLVLFWLCIYFLFKQFWNGIFSLNTNQMVAMFIIMWTHAIFGFWSAEQRVDYKYRLLLIVTLVEALLQPILCVLFIHFFTDKVSGVVWGIALATFLCYISLFASQIAHGRVIISKKIWMYGLKLGIPLIPHYISTVLLNSSDRIMIQKIVGEGEAGIYNLAYTISICGVLINQALLQTLQPWIFQKLKMKKFEDIKRVAYPALVTIAVVNILVILFAPEIISLFAPTSYFDAIWVMPPITMSVFFMFMYNLFSSFEFYYEKTSYISIATVLGASLNIILNYIFIKLFGYYAAGYTTLVCYIVFAVAHYYFMRKICKEDIDNIRVYSGRILMLISGAFIAGGFIIMFTYNCSVIRYCIAAVIVIMCFLYRHLILRFVHQLLRNKAT